ncbi:hypothetical protein Neosp_003708 [[Neocosmospora] mangrovei]
MADGIAEIDDCWNDLAGLGVPYSSSGPFDACWESESESSWSEWSYDQDGPCSCGGNYAPTKTRQEGNNSAIGNQVNVDHTRPTAQKDKGRSKRRGVWQEERGVPPLEDIIYLLAKRQRHHNDEQKRIRDWLRVMGDLEGGDDGVRVVGRERERRRYVYDRVERREPRRYEMSGGRSTGEEEEPEGRRRKLRVRFGN